MGSGVESVEVSDGEVVLGVLGVEEGAAEELLGGESALLPFDGDEGEEPLVADVLDELVEELEEVAGVVPVHHAEDVEGVASVGVGHGYTVVWASVYGSAS